MIYDIPKINLEDKVLMIDDNCCVEYDMLKGTLLINKESVNRVLFKGKELELTEFLNYLLENEY